MRRPQRFEPGPGQESVWDYPRPPAVVESSAVVEVHFGGMTIGSSSGSYRVLETSHPPTFYLPPADLADGVLRPADGGSFCEWKGRAVYLDVVVGERIAPSAAWSYPSPTPAFRALAGHISFYPALVQCTVNQIPVTPQAGGFYGGWVTPDVLGPFKGDQGTSWW